MSDTVKCVSCNIVIDELLAYVQNKVSIADETSLVKICASAFTSEQIQKSKSLLIESLSSEVRSTVRKGKGKDNRVLNDIIAILKTTDPDILPVFVARDLEKLPPITFDHLDVSKLLKDLVLVKVEIDKIKSSYVTQEELQNVKTECNMKLRSPISVANVNTKRGASSDNSFMCSVQEDSPGSYGQSLSTVEINHRSNNNCGNMNIIRMEGSAVTKPPTVTRSESHNGDRDSATRSKSCAGRGDASSVPLSTDAGEPSNQLSEAMTHSLPPPARKSSYARVAAVDDGFTVVQYKKQKYKERLKGSTGSSVVETEEKFRSADRKIPMFITNVHRDASESHITCYIEKKTGEKVNLERIKIMRQCEHNAFKFFVSQSKLQLFLDDKLWPQGIIFRRFVNYKLKRVSDTSNIKDCGTQLSDNVV